MNEKYLPEIGVGMMTVFFLILSLVPGYNTYILFAFIGAIAMVSLTFLRVTDKEEVKKT